MIKLTNILKRRQLKESRMLEQSDLTGKTIINVDIQLEYQSYFTFKTGEWARYLTKNWKGNKVVFLYNGESMGMTSEGGYQEWLSNYIDYELLEEATFYDKGYAFFRFCMDEGIDDKATVDLIRFMVKHSITDSREINTEMWNQFMKETNNTRQAVRDLLETAEDMIYVPELMEELKKYSNPVLMGGGIDECLREVELGFMALDKPYQIVKRFTY